MLLPNCSETSILNQRSPTILKYPEQSMATVAVDSVANPKHTPLQARLALKFAEDAGTTRLVSRDHYGPLLVQKPLYPEGRKVCHVVIIHPPGGVVGGDQLELTAHIGSSAHAQITTPGATKWYKANGHVSHQKIRISLENDASLEWVPQETIFYNNADVRIDHEVTLEDNAIYAGCEILCFGRTASGESFNKGQISQRTSIKHNNKMIWLEQIRLNGESPSMNGPLALSGKTVCATFIATVKTLPQSLIDVTREEMAKVTQNDPGARVGLSQLKSVIVARYMGDSSEIARHVMLCVWGSLRPEILNRAAIVPRMWST